MLLVLATTAALCVSGLTWPGTAMGAVGVPVTYVGHSYASTVERPSENKPQSKLWYHDGAWWALMVSAGGTLVHIHQLMPDHSWQIASGQVDSRLNSTGDALWSARDSALYVASRADGSNLQVNRFSYDPVTRTWSSAAGFPVTVETGGGSESATIDQDSLGHLWVTYTRASRIWVAHSTNADRTQWTAGFHPNVPDIAIKSDDLSALIAFGTSIGVMWSDQQSGAFRFAIHDDGAGDGVWRVEDVPMAADDHINLKQLVGDTQGRIFAAIKTSADEAATASPGDTLVGVLTRTPGQNGVGSWALTPAGTIADDHTRPIIMIDATNQELYFFATAPGSGGDVYYKKSPLGSVAFPPGRGDRFVDTTAGVNNASGAKDPVTSETGMVILAVADGKKLYVHAEMELAGGGGGSTPVDPAPTVTATSPTANASEVPVGGNVSATFSEPVTGVSGSTFRLRDPSGAEIAASVAQGAGNQWILDPVTDLAAGTVYTATLTGGSSGIRDAANQSLSPDPVSWSFTTAAAAPADPAPTVIATTPVDGGSGLAVSANITATFSEPVEGVSKTTFTLKNTATGAAVSAGVSYNATSKVATLNPGSNLALGTQYTATLTGGPAAIRDAQNIALATMSWTFTTASGSGDTTAPTVKSRNPAVDATRISLGTNVQATFSEPVQGVETSFTLTNAATGAPVAAVVSRKDTTNTWILNPNANLAPDMRYTVTLTGGQTGVRDAANNALATVSWSFLTGPAPKVSARTPAVNATGMSRTGNVTATFSEPVQGVSGTTFTLRNTATGAVVTAAVAQNGTSNQWIVDPDATLPASTQFTVTITGGNTGVKDVAGNPLATVTWKFTTGL
ncbi:Ig-like domain-containing protein [Blastococcus colisei]|uniref:Ig-like domain-containing protein n=1 Tax=Blastococcus colisei TaxID=1564162 RepID=A0A543P1A9_9ACTN|nr:Ig-like domain-containing protein [Blastococcus colisei]TQN37905.1 Ig-like domain-containing protein [Blastococcus colisei]